jgi:hypothetical protein
MAMSRSANLQRLLGIVFLAVVSTVSGAEEKTENFDRDPGWEARNTVPPRLAVRTIRQDFGYDPQAPFGDHQAAVGGYISAAAEPAYYGKKLPPRTLEDALSASGSFVCADGRFHVLLGFFNAGTLNEWRTPNTMVLRLSGRGDVCYAWLEYATQRWRAGGDSPQGFPTVRDARTGKVRPKGFAAQKVVHHWSLEYDPKGNGGRGVLSATIDGERASCHLANGHKADGAAFNRFGLLNVMKSAGGGGEIWIDHLTINGQPEDLRSDPAWDALNNRRTYTSKIVRPFSDFGYQPSHFAGGKNAGELGGLVFRGDCRFPERMASYADRLSELALEKPLRAAGRVCLKRGVTDSTVLFGFFHSEDSMAVNPSQSSGLPKCFLGISTDGPSREGFFFSPVYRLQGDAHGAVKRGAPRIYPDGVPHTWNLEYRPEANAGNGEIELKLDQQSVQLRLGKGHRAMGTRFNRFGLITTWVDGNSQTIYFDDLTYTCR